MATKTCMLDIVYWDWRVYKICFEMGEILCMAYPGAYGNS